MALDSASSSVVFVYFMPENGLWLHQVTVK